MRLNRRQALAAGMLAAPVFDLRGRRPIVVAAMDRVRVCNTTYYPAARRLLDLTPGDPLDVRFDFDPGFCGQPSAGFWIDGVKVGDAPRRSRLWMGRLIQAGRRLSARSDGRPPDRDGDSGGALAVIEMDLTETDPGAPRAGLALGDFMEAEVEATGARFVRLVGEAAGRDPVFLGSSFLHEEASALTPGEPLRLVAETPVGRHRDVRAQTLEGQPAGRLHADAARMTARMLDAGLVVAGVVLPGFNRRPPCTAALYLVS